MIVLSESSPRLDGSVAIDLQASTHAAWLQGCRVHPLSPPGDPRHRGISIHDMLPRVPQPTPAIWVGFIPTPERYRAVYEATQAHNILLPNTPEQHLDAEEFDRVYPIIEDLTPRTLVVRRPEDCRTAFRDLGMPVFVKGAVKSRKERGPDACIASTTTDLIALVTMLLNRDPLARGRVILREFAPLRFCTRSTSGFPLGREFRVFLHRGRVLTHGYQWRGPDPLQELTPSESRQIDELAGEVASRLRTPFLAVDIAQRQDGRWIVIETGDAQFSGLGQIPALLHWNRVLRSFGSA